MVAEGGWSPSMGALSLGLLHSPSELLSDKLHSSLLVLPAWWAALFLLEVPLTPGESVPEASVSPSLKYASRADPSLDAG